MNSTAYFLSSFADISLAELLRIELERAGSRPDRFSANRDIERLQVAAGYVSHYWDRSWHKIQVSDIVRIDGYAMAERLAPELDEDDKAGIARTVANLVACARAYAADSQAMLFSLSRTTCGDSAGRRSAPPRHLANRTGVISVTTPARRLRRKTRTLVAV